jgi:hypothetical protein
MNFKSFAELHDYIGRNYSDLSKVDVSFHLAEGCSCRSCGCDDKPLQESSINAISVVKITTLAEAPAIDAELGSENEIYVQSADVIKDACGTGSISVLGRKILMNVCEMDNVIHASLDIEVNGKEYTKVPFVVKLAEGKEYVRLSKSLLK